MTDSSLQRAAAAINAADALFIGAGAGMGVDSGLPDFRGDEGFWRAYPPLRDLGISFVSMANPRWFDSDPTLAWGFYGHRLNLYRQTEPHEGFRLLHSWGERFGGGAFVFTSNVDGQFQRGPFDGDLVCECHGSIHHLQCVGPCTEEIWDAAGTDVEVDETFQAAPPLPHCPRCGNVARPNILMFGDGRWLAARSSEQERRMQRWLTDHEDQNIVVIECGAGTAVPTVRWHCERVAATFDAPLVRINPREAHGPAGTISIATGALEALTAIDDLLR